MTYRLLDSEPGIEGYEFNSHFDYMILFIWTYVLDQSCQPQIFEIIKRIENVSKENEQW
jgi:hypothetical protein